MTGAAFDRVRDALRQAGRAYTISNTNPNHIQASCPSPIHKNGNRRKSLSMDYKPAEGKVVWHCHVEPDHDDDIPELLRLPAADFYDEPLTHGNGQQQRERSTKPERECLGKYKTHLFGVVGDDPDHPAPGHVWKEWFTESGERAWNIRQSCRRAGCDGRTFAWRQVVLGAVVVGKPSDLLPYRFPELRDVWANGWRGTPMICEGESDTDAAREEGARAITAGQAGAWKDRHTELLVELGVTEVIITADRDSGAGRRGAEQTKAWLQEAGIRGRIVESRVGKDIRDHLAAGYKLIDLAPVGDPAEPEGDIRHEQLVQDNLRYLRARTEARKILDAEERGTVTLPPIIRLDEFLATPDEEVTYLIDDIWPKRGKILFSAQHKAGKTTARDNVVRSLADGVPFLGKFEVRPITEGRIVVIDNEMDDRMMRRWLRAHGIRHQYRVAVLPMSGRTSTFDLLNPEIRSQWAAHLKAMEPALVLLDCLRPILDALGLSEDKDAGRFLVFFDELLSEAGVDHAMIVHHMGHGGERSRGDSRLLDWPTGIWKLVKKDPDDPLAPRWFSAYGRDVFTPESQLSYDSSTRHLTITGGSRKDAAAEEAWPLIKVYVAENPDCSGNAIEKEMKAKHDIGWAVVRRSIELAEERKEMEIEIGGKGKPNLHRLIEKEKDLADLAEPRTANPRTLPRDLATSPIGRGEVAVGAEQPIDQTTREPQDTCQALTWRVCKNPNCRTLGGCALTDADTTAEGNPQDDRIISIEEVYERHAAKLNVGQVAEAEVIQPATIRIIQREPRS